MHGAHGRGGGGGCGGVCGGEGEHISVLNVIVCVQAADDANDGGRQRPEDASGAALGLDKRLERIAAEALVARRRVLGVPPLPVYVGGGLALSVEGRLVLRLRLLPYVPVLDEAVVQVRRLLQAVAGSSCRCGAGLEEGVGGVAGLEWKTGNGHRLG